MNDPEKSNLKIMMIAGEASGDTHAANLVRALREKCRQYDIEFFGSAGPKMRSAGVEAVVKADDLSIVGVAEITMALPMFLSAFRRLVAAAEQRCPDIVVLVDFPEFNLKLAKTLKKKGFRIVYYISPQLWAWRRYRFRTIRDHVDLLLTILPFEQEWYAGHGVNNVKFVGNPLAGEVRPRRTREQLCNEIGLSPGRPLIALLPGSRHNEIMRILPVMLDSVREIADRSAGSQFVIAVRSGKNLSDVRAILAGRKDKTPSVQVIEDATYDVLAAADAAVITSGTATLEAGILGTPMVLAYKTSALNYVLLKPLVSVEHYGLINLIAGKRVVTELIQDGLKPEIIASEVVRLLDPKVNAAVRNELKIATQTIASSDAAAAAAEAILNLLPDNK